MTRQHYLDSLTFEAIKGKRPLLVCDSAFDMLGVALPCETVRFSGFSSNPRYEDVQAGVEAFAEGMCDCIIAIGGGSCIDTAKSIKYFSSAECPIMAVPTTAGTGSEATHFAVLYRGGEKQSVADERLLPEFVVLQPSLLKTLPVYLKKCTMLDALCQAIESWWSKKATPESV
ncbi:MAG: iron-containing alcohol dehydrogenase, partial [Clostridia bacterium]|nr:iron-containing alcohol dehydrogenase [Clostridia bacterium]